MLIEKQTIAVKKIDGRGGARVGGGRKAGQRNKLTAALMEAVAASGITPLEYMLSVMRDTDLDMKDRMSAAASAAPYTHSKLASLTVDAHISTHDDNILNLG